MFKYYRFGGYSKRLFFSNIVIFLIVIILFSQVVYYRTSRILKTRIVQSNQEALNEASHNIEQYMEDIELLMFNIATNSNVQSVLSDRNERTDFQAVLESGELLEQLMTVDVFVQKTKSVMLFAEYQNRYPIYSDNYTGSGQNGKTAICRADEVRHTQWYEDAVEGRGKIIWKTSDSGSPVLMAVRGILNTKNLRDAIGVIRVVADRNRFEQVIGNMSLGDGGIVCIMAEDMIIWGDSADHSKVEALLMENEEIDDYQLIDGKRYHVIVSQLGSRSWKLIGLFPETAMLNPYNVLHGILLPSIIMAILFSIILVQFNARRMSEPIRRISETMQNYDSNRAKRLETDRTDEIGVLCRSYNGMMDHIDRLIVEVEETANRKRKAELEALQAQINPHFLYNTLDCIKNLASLQDNHDIVYLTTALSEFFRISLNKGSELLPLSGELNHVRSYCEILRFRNRMNFELQIQVPETFLNYTVIKLILQPLVENSIYHGFSRKTSKGIIVIDAKEQEGFLVISVADNGRGEDVEYLNGLVSGEYRFASNGMPAYGIINVDERLKLTFGERSGLKYVESPEGGITAEVWIRKEEKVNANID